MVDANKLFLEVLGCEWLNKVHKTGRIFRGWQESYGCQRRLIKTGGRNLVIWKWQMRQRIDDRRPLLEWVSRICRVEKCREISLKLRLGRNKRFFTRSDVVEDGRLISKEEERLVCAVVEFWD